MKSIAICSILQYLNITNARPTAVLRKETRKEIFGPYFRKNWCMIHSVIEPHRSSIGYYCTEGMPAGDDTRTGKTNSPRLDQFPRYVSDVLRSFDANLHRTMFAHEFKMCLRRTSMSLNLPTEGKNTSPSLT
jgi:hypothetical protein